ncbi:MAG: protein kinase [Gemmataceae bacterium]|nr:protein kinase [Gemmataceae bacterium]
MPPVKEALAEPIPGYRLIEPLGRGGFGEVWKCEAPGGLFKAIKFVYGDPNGLQGAAPATEELLAIERIKAIRHPFLLSMDRVEKVSGELVIVTELADHNLDDALKGHQRRGRPGIPRDQLLDYLREAAEVLDLMNEKHGLQHLDVKPRNLFLVSNHVKVGDFGLVNSLGGGSSRAIKLGAVTPLYAAPEIFLGQISSRCDQYSLAITYQELLTGSVPFRGKNSRQLLLLHTKAQPDLSALPDEDRLVVARALAKDPAQRFDSCRAFVQALAEADGTRPERVTAVAVHSGRGEHAAQDFGADTIKCPPDTDRPKQGPPALPALAGYQLQESLGCTPLADVWKACRPDGKPCLVRLIYGLGGRNARDLEEAVVRFKALRHPALNPAEVVAADPGQLMLVSDWTEKTLRDRWQKCQGQKQPGIPRGELLDYLHTIAEAVDYLYQQQSVHHLGLNPRNLLFDDGRLQMAEFGLAHLFWLPAGQAVAQRNARYSPPELFASQASRTADQYSLAVLYQELLTGMHPFRGRSRSGVGGPPGDVKPDLEALPAADRAVIARALEADPGARWPTCLDLVRALQGEQTESRAEPRQPTDHFVESLRRPTPEPTAIVPPVSQEALNGILTALIGRAGGEIPMTMDEAPTPLPSGDGLRYRFRAGLPIGAARVQLDAFRKQWDGRPLRDDEQGFAFEVVTPTTFWRQWIGRAPGLGVEVELSRPHALSATPIEVTVAVRALRCTRARAGQLLEEIGAPLLEALRAHLLVNSEKRTQDRLLWPYPVQVSYVLPDGSVSTPVECRGKDISLSGIGFYLPHEIPTPQVCVRLPTGLTPPYLVVPATLVRANPCADGWYDVGALFRLATLRKSNPEAALS